MGGRYLSLLSAAAAAGVERVVYGGMSTLTRDEGTVFNGEGKVYASYRFMVS